jgi:hypothetical protein
MSGENYDVRNFVLAANIATALPPAKNYVIISATVDPGAVSLSVGDNNGDPASWPQGITIRTPRTVPARILSSVAQTVAVLMVDGDVEVDDQRALGPSFPFAARVGPNIASVSISVASGVVGTSVISAASNLRGVIVHALEFTLNATVATACEGYVRTVAPITILLGGRLEAGAVIAERYALAGPVFLPAGMALDFSNVVSPANILIRGSFTQL